MLTCPACTNGFGKPYTTTKLEFTAAPTRVAWTCPRCDRVNAPHVDQCSCASPVTVAPSIPTLPITLPYVPSPTVPQPWPLPWHMPQIWCGTDAQPTLGALGNTFMTGAVMSGVGATCDNGASA